MKRAPRGPSALGALSGVPMGFVPADNFLPQSEEAHRTGQERLSLAELLRRRDPQPAPDPVLNLPTRMWGNFR